MNLVIWLIGVPIFFVVLLRYNKLKDAGKLGEHQKQKLHIKYLKYRRNIFTRGKFRLIEKQFLSFACYDEEQLEYHTVKTFEHAILASVAIPIATGLLMRDILMFGLACLVGYIYYDIAVNKQSDKINVRIHNQLAITVQSIRDKYKECDNIPRAILDCDKGTLLDKPITEIYEILMDKDGERRLRDFCARSPIRLIRTLATCCFIVNETGDNIRSQEGSSFAENLITIRQEVDAEINRLDAIRVAFKSLPMIALIGIAIMPLEEWYLLSNIPGTSKLIKGTYGMVLKVIIVVATAVVYYVISVMMRPSVVNENDRGQFINGLLYNRRFKLFVQDIMPKKQIKLDKIENLINGSLSQKDIHYIYASKVVYSAIGFIAGLLFSICFVLTTRNYIYTNYKPLSFVGQSAMSEELYLQVKSMDAEYMKVEEPLEDEDLLKFVKGRLRGLQELELMQQRDRLEEKYKIYHAMTWNWKWGLVAVFSAWVCWFIPEFVLRFRKSLVTYEATEDVMQLQTMALILSATDMDVLRGLYWMEQQATIHKELIRYCYHEYTQDPIQALTNLSNKSDNVEFKKICNKFKSASYKLSLEEAFSDMKLDKAQYMYTRDRKQAEVLESRRQNAKLACVVPGGLALVGLFVLPIIILGISQLMTSFSDLGSL